MRFGQQYDCEMQLKLLSNSTSQKLSTPQPRFRKLSHATTEPRSRDLRARAVSKCTETKHATSRNPIDSTHSTSRHSIGYLIFGILIFEELLASCCVALHSQTFPTFLQETLQPEHHGY
jgi:hypothetical protein